MLAEAPAARSTPEMVAQAEGVSERFGVLVLAKGGHLGGEVAPDALVDASGRLAGGRRVVTFDAPRIETTNTHATGCSLSSALATLRPQSLDWESATARAKRWLTEAIRHGSELQVGHGHGPISHFAELWASRRAD